MFGREKKEGAKYITIGLIIFILLLTFFIIKPFFIALLSAAVIAYVFYPLYRWVKRFIKNDNLASAIVLITVVLLFLVPLFLVLNTLVREAFGFYSTASDFLSTNKFDISKINDFIYAKSGISININSIILTVSGYLINIVRDFLATIPGTLLNLITMLFVLFYLFKDGEKLIAYIKSLIPINKAYKEKVFNEIGLVTNVVVFGQVLAAIAQATLGVIGFYIFGVRSPIFLGLVMIFFGLIPFLGTPFVWVPASLYLIFNGMMQSNSILFFKGIGLFLYGLILIANIDNVVRAVVGAETAKIHPIVIFIGVIGGIAAFGLIGIFIGPVILSLFLILLKFYKKHSLAN